MSRKCFGISSRYLRVFWLILMYYSGWKYWMPKYFTENIWAVWASSFKIRAKSRYKSNFQCVSLLRQICLCPVMFLQSAFQFGFYRRIPVFSPWNLAWNSFYIVKNPNLLVSPFNSPPIDQSFSSILRPENCTAVLVFFFLNPAVEIMIHMLFNTLLKITPHNR